MKVEIKGMKTLNHEVQKKLTKTINKLKKGCPLKKELVITIKNTEKGYLGFAWTSKGKHRIELGITSCKHCIVETLTHEWAHLLDTSKFSHMDSWGITYSKCYRTATK